MKHFADKRGFTLTELLIVLTIMGIVATVAIPSFILLVSSERVQTCGDYQSIIVDSFNEHFKTRTEKVVGVRYTADHQKIIYDSATKKPFPCTYNVPVVKPGTITIQTGPTGQLLDYTMGTTGVSKEDFKKLFMNQGVPCCSVPNNCIKLTITWSWEYTSTYKLSIACYNIDGAVTAHKINKEVLS